MTNRLTALTLVTALAACSGPSDTYRRLYGSTEDKRQHDLNCLDAVVHDLRIGLRAEEVHQIVDSVCHPLVVHSTTTATRVDDQWVFRSWLGASDIYPYFTDGRLRSIQD
jgi:hypothetical protein